MAAATGGRITIELWVDDKGTVRLREATRQVQEMGAKGAAAGTQMAAGVGAADRAAEGLNNRLLSLKTIIAGIIAYRVGAGLRRLFEGGIEAVDEFRTATIGVASTIADLSGEGVDTQTAYNQALAYSRQMYEELELAAARFFASGRDLTQAWQIMAQKGVILREEEIEHLGVIVDKIKLMTAGQVASIQIAQEMRAILTGQARVTDQMARLLKDKLGPEWKKVVAEVRKTGSLEPLAKQFKALAIAGEDITRTLMSQRSTLDTLLSQIGRGGMQGMYEDIVELMRDINAYLREHRAEIAVKINDAYLTLKETIVDIKDALEDTVDATGAMADEAGFTEEIFMTGLNAMTTFFEEMGRQWEYMKHVVGVLWDDFKERVGDAFADAERSARETAGAIAGVFQDAWDAIARSYEWLKDTLSEPINVTINILAYLKGPAAWIAEQIFGKGALEKMLAGPGPAAPEEKPAWTLKQERRTQTRAKSELQAYGVEPTSALGMAVQGGLLDKAILKGNRFKNILMDINTEGFKGLGEEEGGGGKGGKGKASQLERLIDTLEKEVARATGTAYEQVEHWYDKTIEKIHEYGGEAERVEEAISLAKEARAAKMQKLEEDFLNWYAGQTGDTLAQIDKAEEAAFKKWGEREDIKALYEGKRRADALKKEAELLEAQKGQLEAVLAMTTSFDEQLSLMEQIADLDERIAMLLLDAEKALGRITDEIYEATKETIRLTRAQEDYNRALEHPRGVGGGARAWAERRVGRAQERAARTTGRYLDRLTDGLTDAASSIGRALVGLEEADFESIAKEFAAMFIDYMAELLMDYVQEILAQILLNAFSGSLEFMGEFVMNLFSGVGNLVVGFFQTAGEFLLSVGKQIADLLIMAGQIVAALIRAALSIFGLFHTGGIVTHVGGVVAHTGAVVSAHTGLLLAHSGLGLGPDERLVRAKVGEMIISRPGTDRLHRDHPGAFNYLNRGELPPRKEGGRQPIVNNFVFRPPQSASDYDRLARKIVPAIKKRERRRVA